MSEVEGEEAEAEGGKGDAGRPVGAMDKGKRKGRSCGDCVRAGRAGADKCVGLAARIKCPLGGCSKAKKRKVGS